METAQITPSSKTPQVGLRRSALAQEAAAWFGAVTALALGWLSAQPLRSKTTTATRPDMVFNRALGYMEPTGTFHRETIRYYPQGISVIFPALTVLLMVPLLRRRPIAAAVVLALGAVSLGAADTDGMAHYLYFIAVDFCILFLALNRRRRITLAASLTALAGMLVNIVVYPVGDTQLVPTHATVVTLMATVAFLIGDSVRSRRAAAQRLREETAAAAVTTERLRIARELHDMIAHSVGIIAIQAGVGSRVITTQPEEARKALQAIEETSRETLSGLRRTLTALRHSDSGAVPNEPTPGLADLEKLIAATRHAGVRVDLSRRGIERPLPADIDLAAYRIVQEALTNVVRHSGTNTCRVLVSHADDAVALEILDNGQGALHTSGSGFGLVGMRERVTLLHGDFDAGPRPGGGFRVAARLPIPGFTTTYRTVKKGTVTAAEPMIAEPAAADAGADADADADQTSGTEDKAAAK